MLQQCEVTRPRPATGAGAACCCCANTAPSTRGTPAPATVRRWRLGWVELSIAYRRLQQVQSIDLIARHLNSRDTFRVRVVCGEGAGPGGCWWGSTAPWTRTLLLHLRWRPQLRRRSYRGRRSLSCRMILLASFLKLLTWRDIVLLLLIEMNINVLTTFNKISI